MIVFAALAFPPPAPADPYLQQEAGQAGQANDDGSTPPDDAGSGGASAPAAPPASPQASPQAGPENRSWPRQITGDGYSIFVYAPQLESWDRNTLRARAAVVVQAQDAAEPTYGVIWLSARTHVDAQSRIVTLNDLQITKANFPSGDSGASNGAPDYVALLRTTVPLQVRSVDLAWLQAHVAAAQAVEKSRKTTLKNDPPRIIYSTTKAMLVPIDGAPVRQPVPGTGLWRVVNTRALLLVDSTQSTYYLYVVDQWLSATSIDGPWSAAQDLPDARARELDTAKQAAVAGKRVDLLDQAGSNARMAIDWGDFPTVYTSTVPAALIQVSGAPLLAAIEGTQLQQVQNTSDNIIQYTPTQDYYVLVAGRWFRSPSLNGPWRFVAANQLPADFAQIPPADLAGTVLASVAGTPQAQQALIDNAVPQTATVPRRQASFTPSFDGEPRFKPIAGTGLRYAVNASAPIIEYGGDPYYAVDHGTWFVAQSPRGHWDVATSVPSEIYRIPPGSPLYYTTFVNVYGSTDDEVYVGYTPGYLGAFASPDGVVVYGTGWAYDPWVGSYWIGAPATYGFDTGIVWDPLTGYAYGFGDDVYYGPWWGPLGERWADGLDWRVRNLGTAAVYARWGAFAPAAASARALDAATERWRDDLYAGRDGLVYRRGAHGWEGYGGDWRGAAMRGIGLEQDWFSRRLAMGEMGAYRAAGMRSGGAMGFRGRR